MEYVRSVSFVVHTLSRKIGRRADRCAGRRYLDSLTGTNGWIIGYLAHNSDREIFQKDIEEAFSVRRSTVSRVVTLMENKGLVERRSVQGDARLKKLVLTDKALEIHTAIEKELEELNRDIVEGIPQEEVDVFMRVAGRMIENLDECHHND